jgi:hypothetical protein
VSICLCSHSRSLHNSLWPDAAAGDGPVEINQSLRPGDSLLAMMPSAVPYGVVVERRFGGGGGGGGGSDAGSRGRAVESPSAGGGASRSPPRRFVRSSSTTRRIGSGARPRGTSADSGGRGGEAKRPMWNPSGGGANGRVHVVPREVLPASKRPQRVRHQFVHRRVGPGTVQSIVAPVAGVADQYVPLPASPNRVAYAVGWLNTLGVASARVTVKNCGEMFKTGELLCSLLERLVRPKPVFTGLTTRPLARKLCLVNLEQVCAEMSLVFLSLSVSLSPSLALLPGVPLSLSLSKSPSLPLPPVVSLSLSLSSPSPSLPVPLSLCLELRHRCRRTPALRCNVALPRHCRRVCKSCGGGA